MRLSLFQMISLSLYKQNVQGGLQEIKALITSYATRFRQKSAVAKAVSIFKILCVPLALSFSGHMTEIEQIIGTIALMTALVIPRLQNNKHINAMIVPLAFLLCTQSLLLGNMGYAAMTATAVFRYFVFAATPDTAEAKPFRMRLAIIFVIIGIFLIGFIGVFDSAWAFLPMGAMICGTFGSSLVNSSTAVAHLFYATGGTLLVVYNLAFWNIYAVLAEGLAAFNHAQSYAEKIKKREGEKHA